MFGQEKIVVVIVVVFAAITVAASSCLSPSVSLVFLSPMHFLGISDAEIFLAKVETLLCHSEDYVNTDDNGDEEEKVPMSDDCI